MATTLTDAEIETVREIVDELYTPALVVRLDELNAAEEAATRIDITTWLKIRNKTSRLAGGRDALYTDPAEMRRLVRNRVRARLGLSEIPDDDGLSTLVAYTPLIPTW